MERAISEMEKIRRAEEIYSRRKNSKNESVLNETKNLYKSLFHTLLMVNIIILVLVVQNRDSIFTQDFISKVNAYNVNIKSKIGEWITNKEENLKENKSNPQKLEQNVDNISSNTEENAISGESNEVQGSLVENESQVVEGSSELENLQSELSQMEKDSIEIKENYSIQLPVKGIKTSSFGYRKSSNSKVTAFHTGVDIAAMNGTIIKSASNGKVSQVSEIGDYGKHLKIAQDNLTLLYAHCSAIYVKEGDEIHQGQPIAEVGSTGNSTGPHLHFEIRYNNRLVNPEFIIEI